MDREHTSADPQGLRPQDPEEPAGARTADNPARNAGAPGRVLLPAPSAAPPPPPGPPFHGPPTAFRDPHPPRAAPHRSRWPAIAAAATLGTLSVAVLTVAALIAVALFPLGAETVEKERPESHSADPEHRFGEPAARESADNPVYTLESLPRVDCELPEFTPASAESWEAFAPEAGECLDRMWSPHMEQIGVVLEPVEYRIESEAFEDEHDEDSIILGYYQSNTISIVLPSVVELLDWVPNAGHEGVWMGLIAHEYAHYVQDAAGILGHSWQMELQAGDEEESLEMVRRNELQAECLAGAALHAAGRYDDAEIHVINEVLNGGSDSVTHGSAVNRKGWLLEGWNMATMADCNTYTAEPDQVA